MAEAVARQDAGDVIEPASAGLAPLGHIERMTIHTLACNGYPAKGLASKPITEQGWKSAELVINMSGRPSDLVFKECLKVEEWEVEDPYGADQATYQRILDDIVTRVNELADRLRKQQQI
jgi:protein-tyrosine-phosphatase